MHLIPSTRVAGGLGDYRPHVAWGEVVIDTFAGMADPATGHAVNEGSLFTLWSLPETITIVTRDACRTFRMVESGVVRTRMRADIASFVRTDGVAEATAGMRGCEIVHATHASFMGVLPATALESRNGHATTFAKRTVH